MKSSYLLDLQIPSEFSHVPHVDDPELLANSVREAVEKITYGATAEECSTLLDLYGTAFGALLAEGAIYIGFGYFRTDDDRLSMASLNVFVKDYDEANPHLIVSQVLNAHSEGGPARTPGMTATAVELPCGPAVFIMRLTLAPDDIPSPNPAAWQAQAVIPFPQGKQMVIIDLSTPSPGEAPYYSGIIDGIAHTVTFVPANDPESAPSPTQSRISDVLG